ncbi:condensation domain-containing protein [Streptomyces sp. NBC_00335]|uniref:condensation domain-containing protein n=1 Tax=unclassified Streptomyces TaxID=2593676 RepID=UPI0022563EE3|nr:MULTISPECIES: condensation domain-containing protein [unclassified Streptomyces]MCX5403588.1 condensation domain-containing protein [Streptomyces sp. NBC_00086]
MSSDKAALAARLAGLDPRQRAALAARLSQNRSGRSPLRPRPGPRDTFPVGMDQERLWILDQLYPGTTTYTLGFGLRFLGEFDRQAFTTAVDTVVRRHELLRCSIEVDGVQPRLRLHPDRGADLEFTDLAHGPEDEREQRRAAYVRQQVRKPFDLSRDPVLRIGVAHLGGGDHQIVQTMPHSFTDQWSYVRLNQELIEAYRSVKEGREAQLPELPVQFGDYAQWQRDYFASENGERHRAFWREYLADLPDKPLLPYDHSTETEDRTGRQYNFVLDKETAAAFIARAKQARSTVANAMTAAYAALLFEESGVRDIVIGVPSVTRSQAAVKDMVGFLLTNVPIRIRIPEEATPNAILAATQAAGAAVAEHHETPFGEIVRAAAPERSVHSYPLLKTMLVHLDLAETVAYEVPGAVVYANAVPEGISSMDATVAWWHLGDLVYGRFEYRTALFEPETVERLARRLLQLVELFATAPDTPLTSPRDEAGAIVTAAWCEALAVPSTAAHEGFAASGGTPLLAVRLARLLKARGFTVGPRDIDSRTTPGALAELLLSRGNPVLADGASATEIPGRAGVSEQYLEDLFAATRGVHKENR